MNNSTFPAYTDRPRTQCRDRTDIEHVWPDRAAACADCEWARALETCWPCQGPCARGRVWRATTDNPNTSRPLVTAARSWSIGWAGWVALAVSLSSGRIRGFYPLLPLLCSLLKKIYIYSNFIDSFLVSKLEQCFFSLLSVLVFIFHILYLIKIFIRGVFIIRLSNIIIVFTGWMSTKYNSISVDVEIILTKVLNKISCSYIAFFQRDRILVFGRQMIAFLIQYMP